MELSIKMELLNIMELSSSIELSSNMEMSIYRRQSGALAIFAVVHILYVLPLSGKFLGFCHSDNQKCSFSQFLILADIINCRTKYTSYQKHSNGNMVYLDRHRMNCGGTGYIASMLHLQRSGRKMRYKYKCCSFRDKAVCRLVYKTTLFRSDGGGDGMYLDRHSVNCGRSGFINDIRVQRNSGHNKIRYSYWCCQLKWSWKRKSRCYTKRTGMTYDGNGKVYYLDRQTVRCRSGYGLSYFRLKRNSRHDKWAYNYRCCKVNH